MSKMKNWMRAVLGVAACAGLLYLAVPKAEQADDATVRGVATTAQLAGPAPAAADGQAAWFGVPPPGNAPEVVSPLSTMSPPRFFADGRGKLVLNGDTHANIEKLLLEEDPAKMQANLESISSKLPAQAAAELKVLVTRFQQYSKALPHTISPDHAPETEQESLKLLDSLHALRVSYLGQEAAQAMFGAEEATARRLIALMAAEKDPNLTPQQKAERAQEVLRDKDPAAVPAG